MRHPGRYYPCIEQQLLETGESFESYVCNIFHGKVWGDDLVAAAFGDMWNISVSIITPISKTPINLFHNSKDPHVVLIANGGCWTSGEHRSTHFSATKSKDPNRKIPGSEYTNMKIAMDKTPNLDPLILSDKGKAKQMALKEYMKQEEEKSLHLLKGVSKSIDRLNSKIVQRIGEVDELVEEKNRIEHKLKILGISADKIEDAGMIEPRQYVRTEEREKLDKENAAKRKREEEEKEAERKRLKTIPTVGGKRRVSFEEKGDDAAEEVMETGESSGTGGGVQQKVMQKKQLGNRVR